MEASAGVAAVNGPFQGPSISKHFVKYYLYVCRYQTFPLNASQKILRGRGISFHRVKLKIRNKIFIK